MGKHNDIDTLLKKYVARELSPKETNELFSRLRSIHNPRELDDILKNHWKLKDEIQNTTDLSWTEVLADHKNRIQLEKRRNHSTRIRFIWQWGIAASLLFLIGLVWWNWSTGSEFVTYKTEFAETKNILLDDGTTVVLNANSQLTWKKDWISDKSRYATLKGEAYFQIAHRNAKTGLLTDDPGTEERMPLRVKTSDVVIDVLGTTFNVSNRRGETMVFLEKGSVKLGLLEELTSENHNETHIQYNGKKDEISPRQSIMMEPGETVKYSAESQKMLKSEERSSEQYTKWKDGTLLFDNMSLGEILRKFEDIYGKKFETNDFSLLNRQISMGIPYKNWDTVKELMEKSLDVEVIEKGDHKIIIRERKE